MCVRQFVFVFFSWPWVSNVSLSVLWICDVWFWLFVTMIQTCVLMSGIFNRDRQICQRILDSIKFEMNEPKSIPMPFLMYRRLINPKTLSSLRFCYHQHQCSYAASFQFANIDGIKRQLWVTFIQLALGYLSLCIKSVLSQFRNNNKKNPPQSNRITSARYVNKFLK